MRCVSAINWTFIWNIIVLQCVTVKVYWTEPGLVWTGISGIFDLPAINWPFILKHYRRTVCGCESVLDRAWIGLNWNVWNIWFDNMGTLVPNQPNECVSAIYWKFIWSTNCRTVWNYKYVQDTVWIDFFRDGRFQMYIDCWKVVWPGKGVS